VISGKFLISDHSVSLYRILPQSKNRNTQKMLSMSVQICSNYFSYLSLFRFWFRRGVLDLDLPEGEGHKSSLGEAPWYCCRPASALSPDLARGENQMSTSTDSNACEQMAKSAKFPILAGGPQFRLGWASILMKNRSTKFDVYHAGSKSD
jgi:hypothetical protein